MNGGEAFWVAVKLCREEKLYVLVETCIIPHECPFSAKEASRNILTSTRCVSVPYQAGETGVDREGRRKLS